MDTADSLHHARGEGEDVWQEHGFRAPCAARRTSAALCLSRLAGRDLRDRRNLRCNRRQQSVLAPPFSVTGPVPQSLSPASAVEAGQPPHTILVERCSYISRLDGKNA